MKRDYYLRSVDNPFWLCKGPFDTICGCYSLNDLMNTLKSAPAEVITHHITNEKNDFANWINEVIGLKTLGTKILKLKATTPEALKSKIVKELELVLKAKK